MDASKLNPNTLAEVNQIEQGILCDVVTTAQLLDGGPPRPSSQAGRR